MRYIWQKLFRWSFLFLILVNIYNVKVYACQNPVKWEEIKGWTYFDPYWAGGLDKDGNLLALYDFSFPTLSDRVSLGFFDPSLKNYDRVIQLLSDAQEKGLPGTGQGNRDALEAIRWLKKLRNEPPVSLRGRQSILAANWWKQIPWKNRQMRMTAFGPQKFFLSDIDFHGIVKHHIRFNRKLKKLGSEDIFEQFEFVLTDEGTYQVFWNPSKTGAQSIFSGMPPKLVDFKCPKCGLQDSLIFDTVDTALNGLVSLIPIPVVGGLVSVGLGEYFQFQRELFSRHQEMALEMLRTAEENPGADSPFSSLSKSVRDFAAGYILFAESTLGNSLKWIGKDPQRDWGNTEAANLLLAKRSSNFLTQKGIKLSPLNDRFAVGMDANQAKYIYLLSSPRYSDIFPPFVGIDYQYPDLIPDVRLGIEVAHILVLFLKPYIPYTGVGSVVGLVFKYLIEQPIQTVKNWEARLAVHLNYRSAFGENWSDEMNTIYRQTINPLEVRPDQALSLVKQRRSGLGRILR